MGDLQLYGAVLRDNVFAGEENSVFRVLMLMV
jgi:hypothetical protein